MLRNNNTVLKNGGSIFKGQRIDSYIETSETYYYTYHITLTGLTVDTPFTFYMVSNLENNVKIKYTFDRVNYRQLISPTNLGSGYKSIYTYGNLDAVTQLELDSGGNERGDLIGFMNQFPYLENFAITTGAFTGDISYTKFPKTLRRFYFRSDNLYADITTIQNFDKIEDLNLIYCQKFSGSLNDVGFDNLTTLNLNNCPLLEGNIDGFDNLNYISLNTSSLIGGNLTTFDTSNLTYLSMTIFGNTNISGSATDWVFSSGLTLLRFNPDYRYTSTDVTNWDISNTQIGTLQVYGNQDSTSSLTGDLSNWDLPNTLSSFIISNSGINKLPKDFTNTITQTVNVYYTAITSISGITYPDTIRTINIRSNNSLVDDIGDIVLNDNTTAVNLYSNSLTGNIQDLILPISGSTILLYSNEIGGYLSGATISENATNYNISDNNITGNIVGLSLPPSLTQLQVNTNPIYFDFDEGVFNTSGLTHFYAYSISGITGDLSNFILGDNLDWFDIRLSHANSDIEDLVIPTTIKGVYISDNDFYGDASNLFNSGHTQLVEIFVYNLDYMSGDTSNWGLDSCNTLNLYNTSLTGRLSHSNPYSVQAFNSNFTSDIGADFNFANRGYNINLADNELTGNLSGVTLYSSLYYFKISNNSGITGSDDFADYIFDNRKFFTRSVYLYLENLGDTITGLRQLGDLGTYPTGATNYQWDLTEAEVNNLEIGTDYDGLGTNTAWTQAEKIYWMETAKISSTNLSYRYVRYYIYY